MTSKEFWDCDYGEEQREQLAAERDAKLAWAKNCQQLQQQLAAEQEKMKEADKELQRLEQSEQYWRNAGEKAEQQLAAERENHNRSVDAWAKSQVELSKKLAAALKQRDDAERDRDKHLTEKWETERQLAAERDKVHRCEVIHRHRETIELLKDREKSLVDAVEWYATASYPDDGSGRPPDAYRKIAADALAKVKDFQPEKKEG